MFRKETDKIMVFFIADTHFFHANVIKFDKRPWNTIEEMHEAMLEKWNNKVGPDDTVYILGDYTWRTGDEHLEFLKKLNGRKRLIAGNHDFKNSSKKYKTLFESIKDYDDIKVTLKDGSIRRCILSHYFIPFYNGHFYEAIHLHGHSHITKEHDLELEIVKNLNENGSPNIIINVGCMLNDYEPKTLDELLEKYNK